LEIRLKMSRGGTLLPLLVLAPLLLAAADFPAEKSLPPSCQRQHLEEQKCEVGRRSCNQHTIERWRKRCQRDIRS